MSDKMEEAERNESVRKREWYEKQLKQTSSKGIKNNSGSVERASITWIEGTNQSQNKHGETNSEELSTNSAEGTEEV
jgi:hypothetical protein